MIFPIFVTIMLIGMIWSGLGYSGGALLFAILLVIGGWAVILLYVDNKSQNAAPPKTQPSPNFAKSTVPASSSRPVSSSRPTSSAGAVASGYAASSGAGSKWDNSDEAGGLPRAVSPFSDIDDPYDRMALEDEMFHEDFEMFSGGDPFGGGWLGEDD